MATNTNISAIANIPELFEAILVQLPFLNLVITTRVNKEIHDFIHSNQRTQRKLFLRPNLPEKARARQQYMSKSGFFGIYLLHNKCLNEIKKRRDVVLCPFLLEPSRVAHPRTSHFTERVLKMDANIPGMCLTQPPCAHAYVFFTYGEVNDEGVKVRFEAGRSVYCRNGVTIAAIGSALWQSGAIRVSRGIGIGNKGYTSKVLENVTMAEERVKAEEHFKCKLVMEFDATMVSLHGMPVISEEVTSSLKVVGRKQRVSKRKSRYTD